MTEQADGCGKKAKKRIKTPMRNKSCGCVGEKVREFQK
jgi:hypothetical protein